MVDVEKNLSIIKTDSNWKNRRAAYKELGDTINSKEQLEAMKKTWSKEAEQSRMEKEYKEALDKIEKRFAGGKRMVETTTATEVTKESEDALHLKLLETQTGKLNIYAKTAEITSAGKLIVKNLGEKDRIWDIDINIGKVGNSKLEENYLVQELAPGAEWVKEYEIAGEELNPEDIHASLPFVFSEFINTQPAQDQPSLVLVYGKEMETVMKYSFKAKRALKEITITKQVIGHFTNPSVVSTSVGEASIDGENLVWTIEAIEAEQEATLEFKATIKVENVDVKRTGTVNVKCTSTVEGALSTADVSKVDGLTKNYLFIDADEKLEEPDTWACRLVVENPSEFPIEIHAVKVWSVSEEGTEETVFLEQEFEEDEIIITSGQEWVAPETWEVQSEDVPKFKKFVFLTVKPEIMYAADSVIDYEDQAMQVAYLQGAKKYNVGEIASFRLTPIPTMIRVANTGSLELKETVISDVVPAGLEPPAAEKVKVFVVPLEQGGELKEELPPKSAAIKDFTVDFVKGGSMKTEEGEVSAGEGHIMNVTITRQIKPNEVIYVYYEPVAQKPKAEDEFTGIGHLKAELTVPAPPIELDVKDFLSVPKITVSHLRRAITTGKQVFPGASDGLYEVVIRFKNRGDTELENIKVKDFVPESFNVESQSIEAAVSKMEEGELYTWTIEKLPPGENVDITYTIKGTGEYKVGKAQVSYS